MDDSVITLLNNNLAYIFSRLRTQFSSNVLPMLESIFQQVYNWNYKIRFYKNFEDRRAYIIFGSRTKVLPRLNQYAVLIRKFLTDVYSVL